MTARSALGGEEGSILDIFGGDYEWDMYEVKLHANRGESNGVTIRYAKNLTDLEAETDFTDTYTSVIPYYTSGDDTVVYADAVYSEHVSEFVDEMMVPLDLSSEFDSTPSTSDLQSKAKEYMSNNSVWNPTDSITASFVNLWETEEYKNIAPLEKVKLCDYVTVIHENLGIQSTMRVVKTEYNVLLDRYNEIELGDTTDSVSSLISGIETSMKSDVTNLTNQVAAAISSMDKDLDETYVKRSEISTITKDEIDSLFE
jgi:phage minor structural protein